MAFSGVTNRLGGLFGGDSQNQSQNTNLPQNFQHIPRFGPEVQNALSQILQMSLGGLQQQQGGFEPIRQKAITQFNEQTIPSIAERFTSMGGQRSSAFKNALGQAGAGLQENLAAQESEFGQQRQGDLMQLLQLGLTPQSQTAYQPESPGVLQSVGKPLLQGLGYALPLLLTGASGGAAAGAGGLIALLSQLGGK